MRGQSRIAVMLLAIALCTLALPRAALAQDTPETAIPDNEVRAYELPGENLFPEGIAYREGASDFFVGSTTDGAIYRVQLGSGEVDTFSDAGADGRTSAIGLELDGMGRLAVAGGQSGQAWVYDTADGQLLARLSGQGGDNTFINDIAITPFGDLFATDSFSPVLYRFPLDGEGATPVVRSASGNAPVEADMEPWLSLEGSPIQYQEGFNLNGIVATEDGQYLLAAQSNTGMLFRIEIQSQAITPVDLAGGSIPGGDGLWLDDRTLFAVSNGGLTVLELSEDFASGEIAERKISPAFISPTTTTIANGCLLVVNSQFQNQGGEPVLPFTVSAFPVGERFAANGSPVPSATPQAGVC